MKTFFETLPKHIKVAIHTLEVLVSLYVSTALMFRNTEYGVLVAPYVGYVIRIFVLVYPPLRALLELLVGVPGTAPDEVNPPATNGN